MGVERQLILLPGQQIFEKENGGQAMGIDFSLSRDML